jgi:hypothetical protein
VSLITLRRERASQEDTMGSKNGETLGNPRVTVGDCWPQLSVIALTTLAAFPGLGRAYSVGEAELLSSYSQPLLARVPVRLNDPEEVSEAAEITARLLPLSAYASLGLIAPPIAPEQIQISVSGSGTQYAVELRSQQMMREPVVTLMLEVRVHGVRILREMPLIFDLPGNAAAIPAAATPSEPALQSLSEGQPQGAAPPVVAAAAPEPSASRTVDPPRERGTRTARRSPRGAASKPAASTMFRLAEWNPSYSTQMPLPRFQLDHSFGSYRQMVTAAGPATAPVQPVAPAAAGAVPTEAIVASSAPLQASTADTVPTEAIPDVQLPAATAAAMPAVVPAEDAAEADSAGSGWGLLLTGLALAAGFGGWLAWRRRRPQEEAEISEAQEPVLVEESRPKSQPPAQFEKASEPSVPAPAPAAPAVLQPSATMEPVKPEMAAVSPSPIVEMVPPDHSDPATDHASAALRARVADLLDKTMDQTHRRKLQLVEAYLDLGRIESAGSLLSELENDLIPKSSARIPFTLIKG